jgi:hypothetical protein
MLRAMELERNQGDESREFFFCAQNSVCFDRHRLRMSREFMVGAGKSTIKSGRGFDQVLIWF